MNGPLDWRESYRLLDLEGVTHMSLIVDNDDLDNDQSFMLCVSYWVTTSLYARLGLDAHVTCVACALFQVHEGRISLWAPTGTA
jgi:hypothetical protein